MALRAELGEVGVVWASTWRMNTARSSPANEIFMLSVACCDVKWMEIICDARLRILMYVV